MKYEYEYVSVEQQTLEEVMATPTSFLQNDQQSLLTWKRAIIFMKEYVGDAQPKIAKKGESVTTLTGSGSVTPYVFRVTRSLQGRNAQGGNTVRFSVQCYEKKGSLKVTSGAKRNAHNLARFLTSGQLERSYLK